jgi:hypothetical protein
MAEGVLIFFLFVIPVAIFAWWALRTRKSKKPMYCLKCGATGRALEKMRGSMGVELVLWLCFLLPGLIYSAWRHAGRFWACANCGSPDVIPADSPRAIAAGRGSR